MRVAKEEILPEDASALCAGNHDDCAAQADLLRETIINRVREATRERQKAQYDAERARFQEFQQGSLLERLAASPLSAEAIAQAREQWGINHWALMTQAFVQMPEGRRGRPFREDQDLPPQIQQALVLRAAGASWIDCAAGEGVDIRNLRKWRKHPQAEPFLIEQIRGNLQQAQTLFAEAAPKLAE